MKGAKRLLTRRWLALLALLASVTLVTAQTTPGTGLPSGQSPASGGSLSLSAGFAGDAKTAPTGLVWRVFRERAEDDGSRPEQASAREESPTFSLPNGDYIVHVAWGLASATRRVTINGRNVSERLQLNAGGLRVIGMLGDTRIPPDRLTLSIFVPDGGNPQAKLVARDVKPGQTVRLPEGTYHIVSTYLEGPATGGSAGSANAPTSGVAAGLRSPPAQGTPTTPTPRAPRTTPQHGPARGGHGRAPTRFPLPTPGGDVLREMIGAFPSLVLAEGEYAAIARRDGKTYQSTFEVRSARDRDVEVLAK